jgi:23S rRNA (pseudouridine1915-N3)-methyltransferase
MRKIRILCVGKHKDTYVKQGLLSFEKKLHRFCDLEFIFLKEADYHRGSISQSLSDEARRIEKTLSPRHFTVICDDKGKSFSSTGFASELSTQANRGFSTADFIIGGPFGLSEEIKKTGNLRMSLSSMTFTHQLVRLVLIEQIYRAFTIINNEKYHH